MQWQPTKHVRLLCAGREMFPDDPVTKATASTLHCMATDAMPAATSPARKVSPTPPPEQPPVDWVRVSGDTLQSESMRTKLSCPCCLGAPQLDVVDPGVILMWIFGTHQCSLISRGTVSEPAFTSRLHLGLIVAAVYLLW